MRYFIILFLSLFFNCTAQNKDCSDFRTGTFKYTDSSLADFVITRTDSTQTEYDSKRKIRMSGNIKWLSNCQYSLTYKEVNDISVKHLIGITINVDIERISNSSYKFRAYNDIKEVEGKIVKLKSP